jgi:peptidoglycan/LPS O-acetylase OafA/YrhL
MPALDGVRALAVLLVVAYHCRAPGTGAPLSGGYIGVDVFFVLSGFLITSLIAGEHDVTGRVDRVAFFRKRAWRLLPALALFLVVYLAAALWLWPQYGWEVHLRDAALSAAYVNDFQSYDRGDPAVLRHIWSLSVEGQFYVLWPFLIPLLLKLRTWALPALCGLWVAVTLGRGLVATNWNLAYYSAFTHSSGLVVGSALALWRPKLPGRSGVYGLSVLTICALLMRWGWPSSLIVGLPIAEIASAALIAVAAAGSGPLSPILSHPLARRIGDLSYGIYLWHYPIAFLVRDAWPWWQTFALTFGLSTALAAISYYTVETVHRRRRGAPRPAAA